MNSSVRTTEFFWGKMGEESLLEHSCDPCCGGLRMAGRNEEAKTWQLGCIDFGAWRFPTIFPSLSSLKNCIVGRLLKAEGLVKTSHKQEVWRVDTAQYSRHDLMDRGHTPES